jgi:hypothetical protein
MNAQTSKRTSKRYNGEQVTSIRTDAVHSSTGILLAINEIVSFVSFSGNCN